MHVLLSKYFPSVSIQYSSRRPRRYCKVWPACMTSNGSSDLQLSGPQLRGYLERIGFSCDSGGISPASLEILGEVQLKQTLNVLFDNLSLHHPKARAHFPVISTDLQAIYAKIVEGQRGGYCYEVNSLLMAALRSIGFRVTAGAARFCGGAGVTGHSLGEPLPGHDFHFVTLSHFLCLVEHEGDTWLVDAAGLNSSIRPIRMQFGEGGVTEAVAYGVHSRRVRRGLLGLSRIPGVEEWSQKSGTAGYYLQGKFGDSWEDVYYFTLAEFWPHDFAEMNFVTSKSPDSYFVQNCLITRTFIDGRVTLTGKNLKVRRGDLRIDAELAEDQIDAALAEHFGVTFD